MHGPEAELHLALDAADPGQAVLRHLKFDGKTLTGWNGHVDMRERAIYPADVVAELKKKRTACETIR